jgi:hypothetical protein
VVRTLLNREDFAGITKLIKPARLFVLQAFVPSKSLEGCFVTEAAFPRDELEQIRKSIEKDLSCIKIR